MSEYPVHGNEIIQIVWTARRELAGITCIHTIKEMCEKARQKIRNLVYLGY